MSRHGWYLGERLSIFCLFDESIPSEVRAAVAKALHETPRGPNVVGGKPKFPRVTEDQFWMDILPREETSALVKLVGPDSWFIPNLLGLSEDDMVWLLIRVDEWQLLPGYKRMMNFVKGLSVTNDCAEMGVALIQNFVNSTNDESLRQDLILAVQSHREQYPVRKLSKEILKGVKASASNNNE